MGLFKFIRGHFAMIMTSILSAITGIIIASNTSFFEAKTSFTNEMMLQIMSRRIDTYPEVYKVTLDLSSYRTPPLSVKEANAIGHRMNAWLYGEGGLFANCMTRAVVGDIRTKLIEANNAEEVSLARGLRGSLIQALRADIGLLGDLGSKNKLRNNRSIVEEQIERINKGYASTCSK